jgi:hypothetical protein
MLGPPSSHYRSLMIASIIMAGAGWLGVILIMATTLPTVGPRWLFFFLVGLAITGTAVPFVWLIHQRFARDKSAPASILLRQAILFSFYIELLIWLQINRSLSLSLAILLAVGIAGIEFLLQVLDRSRWRPAR